MPATADRPVKNKQAEAQAASVVKEISQYVEDLELQHNIVADKQGRENLKRSIMSILEVPMCNGLVKDKDTGVKRLCTFRALPVGGYCGKHQNTRKAKVHADILRKQEEEAYADLKDCPDHTEHLFNVFSTDCPACVFMKQKQSKML